MLEHLIVSPMGGLCNRMRAIASAKRLCVRSGARCTIAWDWGDYRAVFDDGTDWVPCAPLRNIVPPHYVCVRHLRRREGGNHQNRRVPVTTCVGIAVTSRYVFSEAEEPALDTRGGYETPVFPWLPKPHPVVLERVRVFQQNYFPDRIAGIHIRRTDHRDAIKRSPDEAFFEEADRAVDEGFDLFLATDNVATLRMMGQRYGPKLHYRRKSSERTERWPRKSFVMDDLLDDMVDLWLLAACDHVIGSAASSFSRLAILLNGTSRSRVIDRANRAPSPATGNFHEIRWKPV
jgi:hypothetical protein